ncbi:MAG: metallophosphoesterase [Acidobacteria bacterium]|nr:metallophosphoesterase [Acidobacteriota bacterium]
MSFRLPLLVIFILLNLFAYLALRRAVAAWFPAENRRRRILTGVTIAVLLLNLPLLVFFIRPLGGALDQIPTLLLRVGFYPAMAWLATILAFLILAGPPTLLWGGVKAARALHRKSQKPSPEAASAPPSAGPMISRRGFLAGGAGTLLPALYGVSLYGVYGSLDEIDVSDERSIPISRLPRSLEGLTIVQLSDLHVGPYIREKELQHAVSLVNGLHPDLVVITGDILDRHLDSLPEAVRGLRGIRSPLGVFTVLGNHDIYSDPYSFTREHRGGVRIVQGLESVGIRTLRNEVVQLGSGQDRLELLGLDWLSSSPSGRNFYRYQPVATRQQLRKMAEEAHGETPKVLLAHHPDTFTDAIPFGIDLTLAGHTHGGGQVVLGYWDGVPIGLALLRFKYLSGLYQENGCSLYVNRGLGYLGIPIRINCSPEISRFKLVRPTSAVEQFS